jgi:hypothetical protein
MPKPNKQNKRPKNVNQLADYLGDTSTRGAVEIVVPATTAQISLVTAELGRKGGKIGGKRRLETMTAKQRQTIAKKAARAIWKKKSKGIA